MRNGFDDVISARVPKSLMDRAQRIAQKKVRKVSELAREAFVSYIERTELEMGITQPADIQPHYPHSAE